MINQPKFKSPFADILPIFLASTRGEVRLDNFQGTGFLIAPKTLVTCWHCVRGPLAPGQVFFVAVKDKQGRYNPQLLTNVEQDPTGADLATATVDLEPKLQLSLGSSSTDYGVDVWSFGYPLTETLAPETFRLGGRFLQGYVTRTFFHEHREFGRTPAFELVMPAPEGLSGSPVVVVGTRSVIGVVYGENDVAVIDQFEKVDTTTGAHEPLIQRVVSFALAHYTDTLQNLRGTATGGRTLRELCGGDGPER
jgi:hypothetical protein